MPERQAPASTADARARYIRGDWVAISAPDCWLLVDLPPQDPAVRRCWAVISSGGSLEDVLDVLIANGLRRAPSFALAGTSHGVAGPALHDGGARVIVRGRAAVRAADGREIVSPSHAVWVDELLPRAAGVTFSGGDPGSAAPLPMAVGVTLAATVRLDPAAHWSAREPNGGDQRPTASAAAGPAAPAGPAAAESGRTVRWKNDGRGQPRAAGADRAASPGRDGVATAAPGVIASIPDWAAPEPTSRAPATGLPVIDGPPAGEAPPIDESSAYLRSAASAARRRRVGLRLRPSVLAVLCPGGHLTPPDSVRCRVCRAPVPPQSSFEVDRPSLGVLRLPSGEALELDRGVLLGRDPVAPDDDAAPDRRVVCADGEAGDVSRTHAEVVLDGWQVFIRDLGSLNGTSVELPGEPPIRLSAGDLFPLSAGAAITLAEVFRCVYELAD